MLSNKGDGFAPRFQADDLAEATWPVSEEGEVVSEKQDNPGEVD